MGVLLVSDGVFAVCQGGKTKGVVPAFEGHAGEGESMGVVVCLGVLLLSFVLGGDGLVKCGCGCFEIS